MGTVAIYARILNRGMNKFLAFEVIGLIGMAVEANLISLSHEQLGEITLMGLMTCAATPNCCWAMDKFAADNGPFMTQETEIGARGAKLELIGGLVRIVASGTLTLFHRRMDDLFCNKLLMALGAELPNVIDAFESMVSLRDVAEYTVTRCNRPVDKFFLAHVTVAFFGYA